MSPAKYRLLTFEEYTIATMPGMKQQKMVKSIDHTSQVLGIGSMFFTPALGCAAGLKGDKCH